MIKCTKSQVRRIKTALRWKIPPEQRQRIKMVLLRESGMTQPLIAAAMDLVAWRLCEACLDVEAASIMLFE
jgi:hypothetical protein